MKPPVTSLLIENCDKADSGLSTRKLDQLNGRGFVKCCFGAFDVLVAGTQNYPDAYLLTACVTIANILDQDEDGVADDAEVAKFMSFKTSNNAPMAIGGLNEDEERPLEPGMPTYSLQTWNAAKYGESAVKVRKIITEEVFHMITEHGYSKAYPEALGMTDFTSIACREMAAAECVHWQHVENVCPSPGTHTQPPLKGTCNTADCDCVEWYQQVVMTLAGQDAAWHSPLIPRDKEDLEATLSAEFLAMYHNSKYHQLQKRLSYCYAPGAKIDCPEVIDKDRRCLCWGKGPENEGLCERGSTRRTATECTSHPGQCRWECEEIA